MELHDGQLTALQPACYLRAIVPFSQRGSSPVRTALLLAAYLVASVLEAQETSAPPPNIVWIVADDLGYGDLSLHGCRDISTPNIDSLARDGVRCTSGYVSAPRCSATRSGLVTGRYQQRFGCELDADQGLGAEITVAERLTAAGYATGLVGKWHLGYAPADRPGKRGFQEFFGFLAGAKGYLPNKEKGFIPDILRGEEPVQESAYLTDAFGREAAAFVERHKSEPFFLYLAFNAPHRPLEASASALERFRTIQDPVRRTYAAMVSAMDDAVGAVLAKLHEHALEERTLVVFLNDNGGPLGKTVRNGSSNAPLRSGKSGTYEGGIRVPFLVRWTKTLPAGVVFDAPVSSLDLAPTTLAAAGVALETDWKLDGVDLLPFLIGRASGTPHEALFWRFNWPPADALLHKWAIRAGDWKLVHSPEIAASAEENAAPPRLYDVAHDPGERVDRAAEHPELVRTLQERWNAWNAELPAARIVPRKGANGEEDSEDGG